jgi:hypothetical protein
MGLAKASAVVYSGVSLGDEVRVVDKAEAKEVLATWLLEVFEQFCDKEEE